MEDIVEVEFVTETKRRILASRKQRGITAEQVFVKHLLQPVADVAHELGSHAVLVYLAILGTYSVATNDERRTGFTVRPSFQNAIQLGPRQFRRAVAKLAVAGYIDTHTGRGRKPHITLTEKGRRAVMT